MQKQSYFKIILSSFFVFIFLLSTSIPVLATTLQKAQGNLKTTATTGFGEVDSRSVSEIVGQVIGVALSFVGVIFLILIIYAGFTWMLARGNEAEAKKAKDLMFDAVMGLIIILAAYAITAFVSGRLTNIN